MIQEPSQFEEDCPPVGGAGFMPITQKTIEDVMTELAESNGEWSARVQGVSSFGDLPIVVACELIQAIAASNDGSFKYAKRYLEEIVSDFEDVGNYRNELDIGAT